MTDSALEKARLEVDQAITDYREAALHDLLANENEDSTNSDRVQSDLAFRKAGAQLDAAIARLEAAARMAGAVDAALQVEAVQVAAAAARLAGIQEGRLEQGEKMLTGWRSKPTFTEGEAWLEQECDRLRKEARE